MTSIFLCSDLHTNFHTDAGKFLINSCYDKNVDVAVVAGDLSVLSHLEMNIKMFCDKYPEVVFVTGNHSYYSNTFDCVDKAIRDLEVKISNFHFLNNGRKIIAGHPFIGATLWFPRSLAADNNKHLLNDFGYIKDCDPIAYERHEETVDFFENNMERDDIVVTHHLPTHKSVDARYKTSNLNCYFACDLDDIMRDKKPSIWCHGHSHSNCDYMHYSTRVCCNPFGYLFENPFFNNSFIIKI